MSCPRCGCGTLAPEPLFCPSSFAIKSQTRASRHPCHAPGAVVAATAAARSALPPFALPLVHPAAQPSAVAVSAAPPPLLQGRLPRQQLD